MQAPDHANAAPTQLTPEDLHELQREHTTLVARNPHAAIVSFRERAAENGCYDPLLLDLLATAASPSQGQPGASWAALRDAGLTELLLDILTKRIPAPPAFLPPQRPAFLKTLSDDSSSTDAHYFPPWWYSPIHGVLSILSAIQSSPGGFKDSLNRGVLKLIAQEAPTAFSHLWTKEERQEYGGRAVQTENNRAVVVRYIRATWAVTEEVLGTKALQPLKDAHAVEIAATCWLTAINHALFASSTQCLLELFYAASSPDGSTVTHSKADLKPVISAASLFPSTPPASETGANESVSTPEQTLALRVLTILISTATAPAESTAIQIYLTLANTLLTLAQPESTSSATDAEAKSETFGSPLGLAFADAKVHLGVLVALRRQLNLPIAKDGAEKSKEAFERPETKDVIDLSGNILLSIFESVQFPLQTQLLTQMVDNYALISFLGTLLIRLSRIGHLSPTVPPFLTLLQHTYACTNQSCSSRSTPQHRAAIKKALSGRWYRVLLALRVLAPVSRSNALTNRASPSTSIPVTGNDPRSVYERAWHAFGLAAELHESSEASKLTLGPNAPVLGVCNFVECTIERCEKATRTCSACKRVKYCSEGCQKRDWKEHKKQCSNG